MGNIKKNAIYNILLSVSQILFPLITFPYISRVLNPEGLGAVTFVDNYTQYFILIAALGIPIYGVREIAKVKNEKQNRNKLFSELIALHLLVSCCLAAFYIASFVFIPKLQSYSELFHLGVVLLIAQVFNVEWLYQGLEQFPFITIRTILIRLLAIITIFILVKDATDLQTYYAINVIAVAISASVNCWYARKHVKIVYRKLELKRHFKPLLYIFSSVLVTSIYTILDSVLLGFLSNDSQVGYYTTSVKLSKILISLLSSLSAVMIPSLAFAFKEKQFDQAKKMLIKSYGYTCLLAVPLSIGLLVLSRPLVLLFAGETYLPAVLPLKILSPTILLIGLSYVFGLQVLNSMGNERYFFRATALGMGISVVFNILLIPPLQAIGASIANLAVEMGVMIALIYHGVRKFNFEPKVSKLIKALAASTPILLLSFLTTYYNFSPLIEFATVATLGTFSYLSIQYFFWNNAALKEIFSIVRQRFQIKKNKGLCRKEY